MNKGWKGGAVGSLRRCSLGLHGFTRAYLQLAGTSFTRCEGVTVSQTSTLWTSRPVKHGCCQVSPGHGRFSYHRDMSGTSASANVEQTMASAPTPPLPA